MSNHSVGLNPRRTLSVFTRSGFFTPLAASSILLIAACSAATSKDEPMQSTTAAVGEEESGFRCSAANVAMPANLPDIEGCINDEAGGTGPETTCRGWTKVGPYMNTSDELRSLETLGAQAYMIEPDSSTLCLYLFRGDRAVTTRSLNGVHCYNKTTCDVCWWDGATTAGVKPTADVLRHTSRDNCSDCHRNGPLLPKHTLWTALKDSTDALHAVCASRGGGTWAQAPAAWTLRNPDTSTIVAAPSGCSGCHSEGFAKGGNYCQFVRHAFADATGSMRGAGKKFRTRAACEQYRSDMGCVEADIDCASADVVVPPAAPAAPETPPETPETPPEEPETPPPPPEE